MTDTATSRVAYSSQENRCWRRYYVTAAAARNPKGTCVTYDTLAESLSSGVRPREISDTAHEVAAVLIGLWPKEQVNFYFQVAGMFDGDYVAVRVQEAADWETVDPVLQRVLAPIAR